MEVAERLRFWLEQRFSVCARTEIPPGQWNKGCRFQPQSGARMQPTAQAVGKSGRRSSP
jgi:hypothetical protein